MTVGFSDLSPENTIEGGTDGTSIGNIGDALKVKATTGDPIVDATVTLGHAHHEIHEGNFYSYSDKIVLQVGGVKEIVFTANATIYEHFLYSINPRQRTKVEFFEAPTYTGGIAVTPANHNRGSTNIYAGTMKIDPTVTVDGTILGSLFFSGEVSSPFLREWILKPSETYLIRITSDKNDNDMSFTLRNYNEGAV